MRLWLHEQHEDTTGKKLFALAFVQEPRVSGPNLRTMILHASAFVAQIHVDLLDTRLDAALLVAIWLAEFSIFL